MVCLPCLALPAIFLGGGTALSSTSNKIFIVSLILTLIFLLVYIYFKYYKVCKTCII